MSEVLDVVLASYKEQYLLHCNRLNSSIYNKVIQVAVPQFFQTIFVHKVKKILKGSLDSIPSPPPSMKIQIIGRKVCLRCEGKTLLGNVNKLLKTKSLLTSPSNVLPYYP